MLNRRTEYIEKIEEKFTQWDSLIKIRGTSGLLDIHKHSENNIRDILNILYGWDLKNLGSNNPNFPIIDLGDAEKKVCFQVTANKSDACYKELETRFIDSPLKLKETYENLHVFILSGMIDDRKGLEKALNKTGLTEDRIYDFKTVLDKVRDISNEEDQKLDRILNILDKNHVSIKYFDAAVASYKEANKGRFPVENTFIEPFLIEEERNPYSHKNKDSENGDDRNGELKTYSEREISKISFTGAWDESPQYILTGDPGSGKSELLRNSFNKMLNTNDSIIPIYIDLSKERKEETVLELLHSELNKYVKEQEGIIKAKLIEELATQLLNYNSVYLFFDGYDEMTKKELNKWNECIRSFLKTHVSAKVVIAVRKNRIINDIVVPVTKIYGLLPFDHEQMSKYISALLKENNQTADEGRVSYIRTKISESRLFLTSPTLVVKMLIQYAALQKNGDLHIAQTKSEAYKNYFEYVILKKLRSSGIDDPIQTIPGSYEALKAEVFKLLSEIAYGNFKNVYCPINYDELNRILEGIESKNGNKVLYQKGVNFFVRELQLIRTEGNKNYFNHYTYQEYFFATWLKERMKLFSNALNWSRSAYVNPKYNQVFVFLIGSMNEQEVDIFFTRFLRWPYKFWMRLAKPLDHITLTKFYFLAEMASESKLSEKDKNEIAERLIEELRPRNDINFEKACKILAKLSPGNEAILKKIIESVISFGSWVRKQGLKIYVLPEIHRKSEFRKCIVELLELESKDRHLRGIAIELLKEGKVFDDSVRDKILELHFLKKEEDNENDGFRYMTEYSKEYPEKCIDYAKKYMGRVAEQHKDKESKEPLLLFIKYYFAHLMHVPGYDEESLENEVIKYIENDKAPPHCREILIQAFYKTGIRNEKIIELLIKKLEENGPLSTIIFMYFRDLYVVRPEIIESACQYLYSEDKEASRRAMNYLSQVRYDGYFLRNGKKVRIAERALEIIVEKDNEGKFNTGRGYAAEYLGHIKYTEGNTTSFMIGKLNNKDDGELHGYLVRYLMNTKYYSPSFFKYMFNNGNGLGGYSLESNDYFENIEKHIPENKIKSAKMEMCGFFAIRGKDHIKQVRKKEEDPNGEDWWASGTEESFKRTALAFQKIVLYGDEAKRVKKL